MFKFMNQQARLLGFRMTLMYFYEIHPVANRRYRRPNSFWEIGSCATRVHQASTQDLTNFGFHLVVNNYASIVTGLHNAYWHQGTDGSHPLPNRSLG